MEKRELEFKIDFGEPAVKAGFVVLRGKVGDVHNHVVYFNGVTGASSEEFAVKKAHLKIGGKKGLFEVQVIVPNLSPVSPAENGLKRAFDKDF